MSALLDIPEDCRSRMQIYLAIIYGRPGTQGSKKPILNKKTGQRYFIEDSDSGKAWRQELIAEMLNDRPDEPFDEAVCMKVVIHVRRPKAHFRKDGSLKPDMPRLPKSGTDIDKVLRAIGDAAKLARWVIDDARIAEWRGDPGHGPRRIYLSDENEIPRTVIAMWSLEEEWLLEHKAEKIKESGPKNLLDIVSDM